jgi:hypothetical protein
VDLIKFLRLVVIRREGAILQRSQKRLKRQPRLNLFPRSR